MIGAIPNRPIGLSARARFYQWVWDRLARGQHDVYAGPGIRCTRTARGMMVESTFRGNGDTGDSRVKQYILTDATNGDYFVCRTLSQTLDAESETLQRTIGASDVFIAKPFALRQSAFDRDVLNEADPGNIGTVDEILYETEVEAWDGATFSSSVKKWSYEYKSATFRIATDATEADPDDWTTQNQTIIPRFVPAVLIEEEDEPVTTETIGPTIIYAIQCTGLGVTRLEGDNNIDVTLLALSDGWAWAKTS